MVSVGDIISITILKFVAADPILCNLWNCIEFNSTIQFVGVDTHITKYCYNHSSMPNQ